MTSTSSEPQSRRWGGRLRSNEAVVDESPSEQGCEQVQSSGQSRRWGSGAVHIESHPGEAMQTPTPHPCEAQSPEVNLQQRRRQQGHVRQQQLDHTLALRAAQDAQASAARAGMTAKVEARNSGGVQTSVLGGEAFYLPEWFCRDQDRSIYERLRRELHGHIGPFRGKSLGLAGTQSILEKCPTYKDIVTRMVKHFEVEACYSIVNFYQDGSHGIGAHTDSLDWGTNMTIGASFGDPRELVFQHKRTEQRFEFPQRNGDVFAFTDVANRTFRHSVPKTKDKVGGRLSVIVWARQGGFKEASLQTCVMPSEQDIKDAGGDWNHAHQLAVTKLTSGAWKRAPDESASIY